MMKKIVNWTFGSVFRTFGKILAFLIIGYIATLIIQKNNVKLSDLFGFYTVKAATTTAWSTAQVKVGTCHDDTCSYGNNYDTPKTFSSTDIQYPVYSLRWRVKASNGLSSENTYTFTVGYQATPDALGFKEIYLKGNGDVSRENALCERGVDSSNYVVYKCTFTPLEDYSSSDYLYITIDFYQSYLTGLKAKISKYEERVGTNAVITQQTNNIIENQNENTQEIIDKLQESATQTNNKLNEVMGSQKVCQILDKTSVIQEHKWFNNEGYVYDTQGNYGISDFIEIYDKELILLNPMSNSAGTYFCYYTLNKNVLNCQSSAINTLNIPNNAYYLRFTSDMNNNLPIFKLCINGNQANYDIGHGIYEGIHDNNTSQATNEASNFFNNFTTNTHGLTSIITAPLTAITSISSSTCTPLHLPIPYLDNKYIDLPCMRAVYDENFGSFMSLYDTITFGIVSYWILVRIFALVKDFKNPEHDEIEVVDL